MEWGGLSLRSARRGDPAPGADFAVVDVWDALLSDRPYRKAWTKAQALQYLKDQSGKQFDPAIVERFIALQP